MDTDATPSSENLVSEPHPERLYFQNENSPCPLQDPASPDAAQRGPSSEVVEASELRLRRDISSESESPADPILLRNSHEQDFDPSLRPSADQNFDDSSEELELSDDAKREMLADLCKGVAVLTCVSEAALGYCHVYLIGTAHVSEESVREVQAATSFIRPQVVFIELCEKRRFLLKRIQFQVPTILEMLNAWKQRRSSLLEILYSWFLAKVAVKLDVLPGSEFRVAYEEAIACGAKVVLGDRDVEVTLRRTWGKMTLWYKTKFVASMIFQSLCLPKADILSEMIEKLKDADMLTLAFEELGKSFPSLMETLVDERDMFMAAVLKRIAEHHSSIVAVVGKGHVAGITKYWGQDIPIHTLMEIPRRKPFWNNTTKFFALSALVAFTSSIAYVYYQSS